MEIFSTFTQFGALAGTSLLAGSVFLVYKLVQFVVRLLEANRIFGAIPGPTKRHWLYGNFIDFPTDNEGRLMHFVTLTNKFSQLGYWRIWRGSTPVVVASSPQAMRTILKSSAPKARGHSGIYRFLEPWLGEGLLVAGGSKWARSRRLLTPAFHFDILKPYINVYNEAAEILMGKIEEHAKSGERFELTQAICACTLDIILRCAFSYDVDPQRKGEKNPYVVAVTDLTYGLDYRAHRPMLFYDFIWKWTAQGRKFYRHCDYVHKVSEDIISKRKQTLETSGSPRRKYLDFLDILLTARDETGAGMSTVDIRHEVDTFLFEGHDTTASAISWILYSLAMHPECQQRAQQEIDGILQGRDSDNIEWSDLADMEYLTQCVKEGLRLHSPVPIVSRELTQQLDFGQHVLPAGTTVQVNLWATHHNARVWGEDHFNFNPERFSRENIAKMDSFQFVPFSAGSRNCIGQHFALNEEKVVLARLLRRFTFTVDPDHVVRKNIAAVMRAETGIMLFAESRRK